jgi:rhomboid protease GluP
MHGVELRLGRRSLELPFEEFESWVRVGRVPDWLWMRYPAVTGDSWVQARDLELYRALLDDRDGRFTRHFGLHRFAWLTCFFLVGAAVLVLLPQPWSEAARSAASKDVGQILERAQWWRLSTYAFVHINLAHFAVNGLFFAYLGWLVENAFGRAAAFLIGTSAVLCGGLLSLAFFVGPTLGSSSLVFGLFGAVIAFGWKYEELIRGWHKRRFGWAVFPWLVALLVLGVRVPGIDNLSHLGGFLGGCLCGLAVPSAWEQPYNEARRAGRLWVALGLGAALVLVAAGPLLGGPQRGGPLPPLRTIDNVEAGYQLGVPRYWAAGEDFLGFDIVRSSSSEAVFGHSMVLHRRKPDGVTPASDLADELKLHDELYVDLDSLSQRSLSLDGRPAMEGCLKFFRGAEGYRMCRVSLQRGRMELQLSLRVPLGLERAYLALWNRILETVDLTEPGSLVRARQSVATHPDKWMARLELARELSASGLSSEAWAEALAAQSHQAGDSAVARTLLQVAADGELQEPQALAVARAAPAQFPLDAELVLLAERVLFGAGHADEAAALLWDARARFPVHEGLSERARLRGLSSPPPPSPTDVP